jgi:N6-L-threonylcarbamoyladenine synthase
LKDLILGIESSCDETAAAVVTRDGCVRSNVVSSQVPIHVRFGGVVPELASRNHLVAIRGVVTEALGTAGASLDDLAAIAVTSGPGLAGALLIGHQVAKSMAYARGLPLVPVDHIQAHIHAPFLYEPGTAPSPPTYPYIALAVSGGHTSIIEVSGPGETRTLGATLDDAAGECFDKIAKVMGLPYPGGVYIDALAERGDPDAFTLPRPLEHRGLDFSFSGLKTAARLVHERLVAEGRAESAQADLAASVQKAIVEVLVNKALRACRDNGLRTLVAAGGVACNRGLRRRLLEKGRRQGVTVFIAPARYCSDNAAMVAGLGGALLARGKALEGDALRDADIYVTSRKRRA